MRKVYFEIKKSRSKTQPFYWTLRATNTQKYCHSETYTQKASAKQAISHIIKAIKSGAVVVADLTKQGK